MSITNLQPGFIPIGTKIYLKNKQLIEIENLKFGDEVLSINILNENIKSNIDTYYRYFENNDLSINMDQLNISSSHITDIRYCGYSGENIFFINELEKMADEQPLLIMEKNGDLDVVKLKTRTSLTISEDLSSSYIISLEKNIQTDTKEFFNFNNKITSTTLLKNPVPLFSMSLSNGNLYVTENLILLGRNI